ncbi:uncharacterized protein N7473_007292 [Penicillium subrubescens]|nr:uncharacterized protein N7473_007292 [Penicillium subrubescens]KAJ5891064.1 hypothetical protein N7473_007292 [Penicillium subrubescens]
MSLFADDSDQAKAYAEVHNNDSGETSDEHVAGAAAFVV